MEQERRQVYQEQARHYLVNGLALLQQGEAAKAAEVLWGSMAQALKAVAARKGKELRQHRELREFARALTHELRDKGLWDGYVAAEHLHSNFYEVDLSLEDVAAIAEGVKSAVEKLLGLAEEPLTVTG